MKVITKGVTILKSCTTSRILANVCNSKPYSGGRVMSDDTIVVRDERAVVGKGVLTRYLWIGGDIKYGH